MKSLKAGAVEPASCGVRRRVAGAIVLSLLAIAALLGVSVPAASAAPEAGPGWAYKANFGVGVSFNFETPRNPVAVDGNGNIFGADQESGSIHVFSPSADGGTPLTDISSVTGFLRNIAVDPSDGTVYSDGPFGEPLRRYVSDGAPTPTYTVDPTFEVTQGEGIAVDPTTGDLLVADPGAEGVRRHDSSGTLLETIGTPSISPAWIATAPDGSFYVAPAEGPDVTHYSGAGTQLGTISGAGPLHGLSYDPSRSAVVVAVGNKLKSYSPAGALLAESPSHNGQGLAISASGSLYQVEGTLAYYAPGTMPGVEAPQVSAIGTHSAHLKAKVDPGAGPPEGSVAHFEYSSDGGTNWIPTPDASVERTETEEPDTVEADLNGLIGNFDYLVRVVAANAAGLSSTSASTPFHTLLTAPEAETGPAISVTETKAELTGKIDTLGLQTTYHFEYGPTSAYGSKVPAGAEAVAGNERGARSFARGISGLQPNTTYHYRLVAKSAEGEGVGTDRTFATSGTEAVRAYEQVSPRNKMGGSVNPQLGFQAAADGSAFAYQVGQAPKNAASAVVFSRVLSRRSSTGWLDWQSLDPPLMPVGDITNTATHAISADFTHTLVASNRALTPVDPNKGPFEGGGNIYIQDLETGEYTYVGGAPGELAFHNLTYLQSEHWYMVGAPDFSWVVLNVPVSLLPEAPEVAVYKWSRNQGLKIESRLPDGSIPVGSVKYPTSFEADKYNQASADGSVVYFSLNTGEGGVYRRSGGQTTAISVSEISGEPTVIGGKLDGASSDGRYAFFRSDTRLTSDAPEAPGGGDVFPPGQGGYLYRYDAQSDHLDFIDLVQDMGENFVWGNGDNGQVVYYIRSVITGGGTGVWNRGVIHEVTSTDISFAATQAGYGGLSIFTSPSGRFLTYLTGNGAVHLYDAEAEADICVSCGVGNGKGFLPVGARAFSNRPPEVVTDEGQVLFDTPNRLLSEDHNATSDVYMYQDGQLTLISPGDGPYNARFADATADGSSVFFTTDEGIAAGDVDRGPDVYDARIGGGFPETGTAAPGCEGEACLSPIGRAPDLESPKGGESAAAPFAISSLRPLSSNDRKKLAKGGAAHLHLTVSRPGTVTVAGGKVDSSPVKAKKAGAISVPLSLSKSALSELRDKGKLHVELSVHFGDASPKVVNLTLNAVATKKGGRS